PHGRAGRPRDHRYARRRPLLVLGIRRQRRHGRGQRRATAGAAQPPLGEKPGPALEPEAGINAWRPHLRAFDGRELLTAALASAFTALIIVAAHHKLGATQALLVPLALAVLVIVLMRPLLAVSIAIVVPILFEGASFGLFTTLQHIYDPFYKR